MMVIRMLACVYVCQDIVLTPQPSDALPHCQYYLTLSTPVSGPRRLQVKVGDCVYVTRDGAEPLSDELVSHPAAAGDRLDIFRVERLWIKFKYVLPVFTCRYLGPEPLPGYPANVGKVREFDVVWKVVNMLGTLDRF